MTRNSTKKKVGDDYWHGRYAMARAFRTSAETAITLASESDNMNPAISQIVLAAIAYADTLTARRDGVINQQDHAAAPRLLRDVMGSALPQGQEARYRRILGYKDSSQYGARHGTLDKAKELFEDLSEFAFWIEAQL